MKIRVLEHEGFKIGDEVVFQPCANPIFKIIGFDGLDAVIDRPTEKVAVYHLKKVGVETVHGVPIELIDPPSEDTLKSGRHFRLVPVE